MKKDLFQRQERRFERNQKRFWKLFWAGVVFNVFLLVGVVYVAVHFINKFW